MKIPVISIGYRYYHYYYCLLPIFLIEGNAKFYLKISERSSSLTLQFPPLIPWGVHGL